MLVKSWASPRCLHIKLIPNCRVVEGHLHGRFNASDRRMQPGLTRQSRGRLIILPADANRQSPRLLSAFSPIGSERVDERRLRRAGRLILRIAPSGSDHAGNNGVLIIAFRIIDEGAPIFARHGE